MSEATLSALVVQARGIMPEEGVETGKGCLCGLEGTNFITTNFRDTFTASEFLHDSPLICPPCFYMYNTNEFRYANWLCNVAEFAKLGRDQVLATILNYAGPFPFALYTTSTYKKQGWIRLSRALSFSLDFVAVAWDLALFHVSQTRVLEFVQVVHFLEQAGISPFFLRGDLPGGLLRKVAPELVLAVERFLRRIKQDPAWKWVVAFYPKEFQINDENAEEIIRRTT